MRLFRPTPKQAGVEAEAEAAVAMEVQAAVRQAAVQQAVEIRALVQVETRVLVEPVALQAAAAMAQVPAGKAPGAARRPDKTVADKDRILCFPRNNHNVAAR